jgi:[ribosomal protein S18]-alanine N-acetyltransferase
MSALPQGRRRLRPLGAGDLDAVLAIEARAYDFPWTRGNFVDSLHAGYLGRLLYSEHGELLGYFIAMAGVDEMHLLNITVAPEAQGQGHARWMLDALVSHCRSHAAPMLWLEVRRSNARAHALYGRYGFQEIGVRRAYYPAAQGRREDALVMSLVTDPPPVALGQPTGGGHGLD